MWDSILQFINALVSPDWNSLVGLVPLGIGLVVLGFFGWQARRVMTLPPQRTRPLPALPAPAGVHADHGSWAPLLAALGAASFFLSILFVKVGPRLDANQKPIINSATWTIQPLGIVGMTAGILALIVGLLVWGRTALRDYDHLEAPSALPAVVPAGPPHGVHIPAPSFRPFLAAFATTVLFLGLAVKAIPIAVAGVLMFVIGGLGWLADARREYHEVERSDATGHLQALPAPRAPVGTLAAFAGLLVLAVLVTAGVIPPKQASTGGPGTSAGAAGGAAVSARSSAAASGSAASGGGPAAGAGSGGGGASATTLDITAQDTAFSTTTLTAKAGVPLTIVFTNNDAGTLHNVSILEGSPSGPSVFKGDIVTGVATQTYNVPALKAGTYSFICIVHPSIMQGTLTVQ